MIGKLNLSKKSGGGSADVVNGIIEQYLAENETIDANTFVEFVNHYQDNNLIDISSSVSEASAVLIDTNKVFIAHKSDSTNNYLNGLVCTISNNNITVGTDTTISTYSSVNSIATIGTNKVFIGYIASGKPNGIICIVSGTDISMGTGLALATGTWSYNGLKVCAIDTDKVFVTHMKDNSTYYLNGIVCTISGTTITKGTDTTLVSTTNSYDNPSITKLDTDKVFITHKSDNTNKYLNGLVCTISGTTITKGTDTTLVSSTNSSNMTSAVKIDTDKVFIAHSSDSTNNYLNGLVCTISGTTITKGTDTKIYAQNNGNDLTFIATNKVLVTHASSYSSGAMGILRAVVCTVSGTTITTGTDTILNNTDYSASYISAVLIDANKVFIAHSSDSTNYFLNGMLAYIDDMDILTDTDHRTIKASEDRIHGLTKTSATTSSAGDVWVLDTE